MVFSRLFKRKPKLQDIDRRKADARHGANLRHLKDMEEWADLIQVKEKFQDDAGVQSVNVLTDDKSRFYAAAQYTTLHQFFLEISRRIDAGEKARKELEELNKR